MNEKYNDMMLCIIVSICIILAVSFGYHSIEKFTTLNVYQNKNTLVQRLLADTDIKRHLASQFKDVKRQNNDNINNMGIDVSELTLGRHKMNELVSKIKILNKQYNHDKLNLDKTIIQKLDTSVDNDIFNDKNAQLKEKIRLYQENIELLKKGTGPNVKILKNQITNKELSIQQVTEDNNNTKLYFLVINEGCLEMVSKGIYKIDSCRNSKFNQLFTLNKIENYNQYNHYIKMGEQNDSTSYVLQNDNIIYPFYILIPYTIPGHCIRYKNNELSVRPINNDIYQRFGVRTISTACQ